MTTLVLCLVVAILFTYLSKMPLMVAMKKEAGGYNNHYPREQQAKLEGFGARARAAHQNGFEALTVYASAILTALATNHLSATIQILAIAYLITRIIYNYCYLKNLASLRSLIWLVGLLICLTIIGMCAV